MSKNITIGFVLALMAISGAGAQGPALTGVTAPNFDLPSLDGERVSLESLRGQFVVLHFGAGW